MVAWGSLHFTQALDRFHVYTELTRYVRTYMHCTAYTPTPLRLLPSIERWHTPSIAAIPIHTLLNHLQPAAVSIFFSITELRVATVLSTVCLCTKSPLCNDNFFISLWFLNLLHRPDISLIYVYFHLLYATIYNHHLPSISRCIVCNISVEWYWLYMWNII